MVSLELSSLVTGALRLVFSQVSRRLVSLFQWAEQRVHWWFYWREFESWPEHRRGLELTAILVSRMGR